MHGCETFTAPRPLIMLGPGGDFRLAIQPKPYFTKAEKNARVIIVSAALLAAMIFIAAMIQLPISNRQVSLHLAEKVRSEQPANSRSGGFSSPYPVPTSFSQSEIGNRKSEIEKTEADLGSGKGEGPSSLARRPSPPPARSDSQLPISDCQLPIDKTFFAAIRTEESRDGEVTVGDGGLSRGDYHISRAFWKDGCEQGGVNWDYEIFIWSNRHCEQVMCFYWRRYCPDALATGNLEILARTHNGGPTGDRKTATLEYWRRIQKHMGK